MHVTRNPVNHSIEVAGDLLRVVSSVGVPELEETGKPYLKLASMLDPEAPIRVPSGQLKPTIRTAAHRLHAVYEHIVREHEEVVTRSLDTLEAKGFEAYCAMVDADL